MTLEVAAYKNNGVFNSAVVAYLVCSDCGLFYIIPTNEVRLIYIGKAPTPHFYGYHIIYSCPFCGVEGKHYCELFTAQYIKQRLRGDRLHDTIKAWDEVLGH